LYFHNYGKVNSATLSRKHLKEAVALWQTGNNQANLHFNIFGTAREMSNKPIKNAGSEWQKTLHPSFSRKLFFSKPSQIPLP